MSHSPGRLSTPFVEILSVVAAGLLEDGCREGAPVGNGRSLPQAGLVLPAVLRIQAPGSLGIDIRGWQLAPVGGGERD